MINIETKNKLEQLEKKVEEMERQLKQKTTLENTVKEMEKRLMIYEDKIRSDRGEVVLKKNAKIRSRRGIYKWAENVLSLSFFNTNPDKLNQIQIGSDRNDEGTAIYENNTIFITAKNNPTAKLSNESLAVKASNGAVMLESMRSNGEVGTISVGERIEVTGDKDGVAATLMGSKTNGVAGIGNYIDYNGDTIAAVCFNTEQDDGGGDYKQRLDQYVDIVPQTQIDEEKNVTFRPSLGRYNYAYKQLVLSSPDGTSYAIKVENDGTIISEDLTP